jgi:hypothetical protein
VRGGGWLRSGLVLFAPVLSGCPAPVADTLAVVETLALPGNSFATLHVHAPDAFWIGAPGELVRLDRGGGELARIPVEAGLPEFVGAAENLVFFRTPTSLLAVDAGAGALLAERPEPPIDAAVLDVRGRYLFRTSGAGAVLGHEPSTLQPLWGWGAVGAPATALGLSPEGDRVYEAIDTREAGRPPELLIRDLQTGRILRRLELVDPIRALAWDQYGRLFALTWGGSLGGDVLAMGWERGEPRTLWRRSLDDFGIDGPARLRLSPSGRLLGILGLESEAGLHVLDVETGETLETLRGAAFDLAFGPADEIYLLQSSELWRVE